MYIRRFKLTFKDNAIQYLWRRALSDQSKARASLDILLDHPAGIGDHSTTDLYDNLDEAISALADAEDRIEILQRYYSSPEPEKAQEKE